ncbi:NAD(P)-dependent alcohol dehydrogenase [Aspergillus stella-maris]|uniref:NAD(P)-dependent alcohol dehydrogenase n=1 Tax=Aspergillus stella-maris TaxID=1810926 RepID=UPI003CCD9285
MASDDKNLSCLLYGPHDARFEDRPVPTLTNPHDVIVRIAYTGVCGSDVHFWHDGGIRTFVSSTSPITVGHEASGTIHAVGSAVTSLAPGDMVAIEPGYSCRHCERCKAGTYNLCPQMKFAADPGSGFHGTLTKYFKVPADFCFKVPKTSGSAVGLKEAVLIEPLAVATHAVRLANIKPGDTVIVFGAGTVGIFAAAVAREFGARVVVSVDINESRLEFAKKVVGDDVSRTYIPEKNVTPEENARRILTTHSEALDINFNAGVGQGVDIAIDASGAPPSIQTAIYGLRMGGTYVQAGMGKRTIDFPIAEMCEKEITAKGCFRYGPGDFKLGISLATKPGGRLGQMMGEFVTSVFPFEKASAAWECAGRGEGVKTLIKGPY